MSKKKVFDMIKEALLEVEAIEKGELKPARMYVPPELDVRRIRHKLSMSQDDFAAAFGFTVHQIRQWEQGRCRPLGAVRAYLMIIDQDHKRVISLLRASRKQTAA